jgi:hypothetical protein
MGSDPRVALLRGGALAVLTAISVACVGATGVLGPQGVDAWAYWAHDAADPYRVGVLGGFASYLYSPAFSQAAAPLHALPWEAFSAVWLLVGSVALVWLVGWRAVPLSVAPMVTRELWYGNIHLLLAAAVVAGLRRPWVWPFLLLTKVTPGVCLLWFVGRRDWRSLGIAIGATATVVLISWIVAPRLWHDWLDLLLRLAGEGAPTSTVLPLGPLWFRLVVAGGIAVCAGWLGRRWPIAIAVVLTLPAVWFAALAMLVALFPLLELDRREPLPSGWPALRRRLTHVGRLEAPGTV